MSYTEYLLSVNESLKTRLCESGEIMKQACDLFASNGDQEQAVALLRRALRLLKESLLLIDRFKRLFDLTCEETGQAVLHQQSWIHVAKEQLSDLLLLGVDAEEDYILYTQEFLRDIPKT